MYVPSAVRSNAPGLPSRFCSAGTTNMEGKTQVCVVPHPQQPKCKEITVHVCVCICGVVRAGLKLLYCQPCGVQCYYYTDKTFPANNESLGDWRGESLAVRNSK